jgi:hypothetical protein
MYYFYVEIEYVATSFSPSRTDLALKLLTTPSPFYTNGTRRLAISTRKKSLEASKATNFPKDFTNFYNHWGVWDE